MSYKYCSLNFGYMECAFSASINIKSEKSYNSKEDFLKDLVAFMHKQYIDYYNIDIKCFYKFLRYCDFLGYDEQQFSFYDQENESFQICQVSEIIQNTGIFFEIKESSELYLIQALYRISNKEIQNVINQILVNDGYSEEDESEMIFD